MGGYTEPGGSCDREEPTHGERWYHIVIQDVQRNKKILSEVPLVYSMNFNSNCNHNIA